MKIDRKEAQTIIAEKEVPLLSDDDISEILSEYCIYEYTSKEEVLRDIKDGELPKLEESAIKYLLSKPSTETLNRSIFKPIIVDYRLFLLERTTNSYLESRLSSFGINKQVSGTPEASSVCPCCNYLSIGAGDEGSWEVCRVCFWENGGDGPNHMSLSEAKANFLEYGAMSKKSKQFVDPEGPIKYAKYT